MIIASSRLGRLDVILQTRPTTRVTSPLAEWVSNGYDLEVVLGPLEFVASWLPKKTTKRKEETQ